MNSAMEEMLLQAYVLMQNIQILAHRTDAELQARERRRGG